MISQVSNRAVANKNDYFKCIALYLFVNVNCSSNICEQQNWVRWAAILYFPSVKQLG